MEYSENDLIELIEKILRVMKSVKNRKLEKEIQHDILYHLGEWTDDIFLKLEPKKVTEEQIDLYIYKALFQLKYGNRYDIKFACDDLKNAMNKYNSQKAKQYLEKGTGILSDELIYYKDENLECKANDVLATIDIKIKNEIAKSKTWNLEYNSDNRLVKAVQSESGFQTTYTLTYKNGDATESSTVSQKEGKVTNHYQIFYTSSKVTSPIANKGCIMFFGGGLGIELDDLEYAYYAGMLGKATKHLPIYNMDKDNDKTTFDWTFNDNGFPTKIVIKSEDERENSNIVW